MSTLSNTKDLSTSVSNQISSLVKNLNKKNYRSNVAEIEKLISSNGYEAYRFLLRLLIKETNLSNPSKDQLKIQFLSQELAQLATKQNSNVILDVLDGVQGSKIDLLHQLVKALSLPLSQQLVLALSITQSMDVSTQQEAINYIKQKLPEIIENGPSVLTENVTYQFLHFIVQCPDFAKDKEKILKAFETMKHQLITSPQFLSQNDPTNSRRNYFGTQIEPQPSEIANLLKEVGSVALANEELCLKFLSQFQAIAEKDVAAIITLICSSPNGMDDVSSISKALFSGISIPDKKGWNILAFVSALKKKNSQLNWKKITLMLDNPACRVADQKALGLLTSLYKYAIDDGLPADCIVGSVWQNRTAQLSILSLVLEAPPDTLSFSSSALRFADLGPVANISKNIPICWTCLDFVEVLLELADEDHYVQVRKLFDFPVKNYSEQLLVTLCQVKPKNQALQKDLLVLIAPNFIRVHKNTNIVLGQIYNVNPQLLMQLFVDSYLKDQATLRRILDISQELKILPAVLETQHFRFIIDFAVLAAKRDHLNLELWLNSNIDKYKTPFVHELVAYFIEKSKTMNDPKLDKSSAFSSDIATIFLRCLNNKKSIYPEYFDQMVQQLQQDQKAKGESKSAEFSISPEIEEKANAYFKDIFGSRLSIDEAIDLLKNLKASKQASDQELFTCMIHNLFDEYRFFPQYPVAELRIVAKLFGSIIQHNIIAAKSLLMALRAVLKALSDPNDQKMYTFGLIALNQFKSRIPEWPAFIQALRNIPSILQNTDIVYFMNANPAQPPTIQTQGFTNQEFEASSNQPTSYGYPSQPTPQPTTETTQITPATPAENETPQLSSPPTLGFQLDISTLTKSKALEIDEETADKIRFIINNVSQQNLTDKVADLKKFLKTEHYPFLAQYLVTNRASLEPNYHTTYLMVLDAIKSKELDNNVLKFTYDNIKLLLSSERVKTVTSERTLLKNLGTWLGLITIEKNKPILLKDLDIKTLIISAYEQGKLIAVIPFVCKVLLHTQNSVIKYPNPWVVGLLSVLVEIHDIPDIKTNIKFEIEVLCKNLKLKVQDIEKKDLLSSKKVNFTNNPDFRTAQAQSPSQNVEQYVQPQAQRQLFNFGMLNDLTVAQDLQEQIKIHESLSLFSQNPGFEKLVVLALDRAIREIISPIVKRSVTIACKTTSELICKDFAMEPDLAKFKRAANNMAQGLASKLAMVTCKDPLKTSMQHHLKTLIMNIAHDPNDAALAAKVDEAVQVICNDNVDLGCVFVERAASEKAIQEITDALATEFESRRKHIQSAGQHAFTQYMPPAFIQALPESMYPRTGLSPMHLAIYDDFKQKAEDDQKKSKDSLYSQQQEAISKIDAILEEVNVHIAKSKKNISLAQIPHDSELLKYLLIVPGALRQCSINPDVVSYLFQSLFKVAVETDAVLIRDVYAFMLEASREVLKKISKQITLYWVAMDGEAKFNPEVIVLLMKTKVFSTMEFDNALGAFCAQNIPPAIKLALNVIKKCIVEDKNFSASKLAKTIDILTKYVKLLPDSENVQKLLEAAKSTEVVGRATQLPLTKLQQPDFEANELDAIRGKVNSQFNDWLNLRESPITTDRSSFMLQIQRSGLIKTDADFEKFCVILTSLCVENFHNMSLQDNVSETVLFKYIDAFSELVAMILKNTVEEKQKVALLHKALIIVSKYLVREHETMPEKFNQRVYLRFFSDLLLELNCNAENPVELNYLLQFQATFIGLQPMFLAAFSFAWLELISHRAFMPKLLFAKQKGASAFHNLLVALLKFLEPYLRNAELSTPIKLLYKGTLKILLVLLHDFSEFLCDYHFTLCDVIPATCIQMRNLILSAFPRHMRLPDPFTPNLKVDLLPEINQAPKVSSKYSAALEKYKLKEKVDMYLKTRNPMPFFHELKTKLVLSTKEALQTGSRYNVQLMNSLVLYTGVQAIAQLQVNSVRAPIVSTPAMDIFQRLILDFDPEGRYVFLNALVNHLRYPNNQTHYFSCVLLYLFAEVKLEQDEEAIQEQITRVLLERLVVNRPHPWGLLITFIELIKNPRYAFWDKKFIHISPEIENLFENVGRSCMNLNRV